MTLSPNARRLADMICRVGAIPEHTLTAEQYDAGLELTMAGVAAITGGMIDLAPGVDEDQLALTLEID